MTYRFRSEKNRNRFSPFLIGMALICFVISSHASSTPGESKATKPRRSSYVATPDELFKRLKPAVVKIVVKMHDVPVNVGAGFFISEDGILVTNHHVLRQVVNDPAYKAEFTLGDGRVVRDFQVADCGDRRGLDLCLIQLKVKPNAHFAHFPKKPEPGESVYLIGHPRSFDFSFSQGMVSGYRKSATGLEEMETTATFAPGTSGGPLFDDKGSLVGIATRYTPDKTRANFAIPVSELQSYALGRNVFEPLPHARARIRERVRSEMKAKLFSELDTALRLAQTGKPLHGVTGLRETEFNFGNETLKAQLPMVFDSCYQTGDGGANDIVHACFGFGDAAVFTLQRRPARKNEWLLSRNGQSLIAPKNFSFVDKLVHDGEWEIFEARLSGEQKKSFSSSPSAAKCVRMKRALSPAAAFSEIPSCEFTVSNDGDPGAKSFNTWIQRGKHIYSFGVWINDPHLSEYFSKAIPLIVASVETPREIAAPLPRAIASTLYEKRLSSYDLKLPDSVQFMGAKIVKPGGLSEGGHFDLYGKVRANGELFDGSIMVITEVERTVLPPSFDNAAREFFKVTSQQLVAKATGKALELEPTNFDGSPARLVSSYGKDKNGRDILILSASIFGAHAVHVVTVLEPSLDDSASYGRFKAMLSTFKRK
jgi:hypothetical protein